MRESLRESRPTTKESSATIDIFTFGGGKYNMYKYVGKNWTSIVMDREVWKAEVEAAKFAATKGARSL